MKHSMAALVATLALTSSVAFAQTDSFALKSGDRVVFYGDSITDQRLYTLFVEQYVVTRFPQYDIQFTHSGWGGDRVTGGGGGPIDVRLDRDVTPYKPTVVTIMLGMNDASYRAFDEGIFQNYAKGYQYLAEKIKKDNPGVRLTFIQPSPFDDVTQAPTFEGGYNAVLWKYSTFLEQLAGTEGASLADLNRPVVAMLGKAKATDATLAPKIIPDRVHPGPGGHLIMAESLLKAWKAPSLVSSVTIDVKTGKVTTENASVKSLVAEADDKVSWTVTEGALPFPLLPMDPTKASTDTYALALNSSDFVEALDQETLKVMGLYSPSYTLKIDDQEIGTFTKEQFATGINLATLPTPMFKQAQLVGSLTQARANVHNYRWREFQVPRLGDPATKPLVADGLKDLDAATKDIRKAQRAAAKPRPHKFVLLPKA